MSSQQQHEDQPQHHEGEHYKPQGLGQPQHDDINHGNQHDGEDYEEEKGDEEEKPGHEHDLGREKRRKRASPPSLHLAAGDSQNDQRLRYIENQQQNTKTRPSQKKILRRPLHRPQQSSEKQQQQQQIEQSQINQRKDGGSSKNTLKLRLDLNLDIEITLKAKIRGDLTLALL